MSFKENIEITEAKNIMPNEDELNILRDLVAVFLANKKLIPPLYKDQLFSLATTFIKYHSQYSAFYKLIAILINNYTWENVVASVPFNRRVLLLPKCIQNSKSCKAKTDELGLLCELCGGCNLANYITTAEELGYNVIVSEGSGAVSVLLNSGQIECVVGVACLDSFERTFPISLKQAIPSIAIPLYNSNCKDSRTNEPWLKQVIELSHSTNSVARVDLKQLTASTNAWFTSTYLNNLFPLNDQSTRIANKWLQAGGKRWRPLIMMAVYTALAAENEQNTSKLAKLAVAIESFHKASLAHDDIVDNDTSRYGEASLLKEHSMKITLNTGDLLLSYGYQLIVDSGLNTKQIQKLITAASKAHRDLCLGQGEELLWQQKMQMPSVEKTIEIFALKTAPAFEVSLVFGAIAAEKEALLSSVLKNYSHAIGIAYQIRDDIDDFNPEQINNDISDFRPSLILAILNENNPELMQNKLHQHINKGNAFANDIFTWAEKSGAIEIAKQMLDVYKSKALESLEALENTSVKILLYQLLNKIIG